MRKMLHPPFERDSVKAVMKTDGDLFFWGNLKCEQVVALLMTTAIFARAH